MAEGKKFGVALPGWKAPPRPSGEVLEGDVVRLERMDPDAHAADLFRAYSGHDGLWDICPTARFLRLRPITAGPRIRRRGRTPCSM